MIHWGLILIIITVIFVGIGTYGLKEDDDTFMGIGWIGFAVMICVLFSGSILETFTVYEPLASNEINIVRTKSNVIVEHGDYTEIINDIATYTSLEENPDTKFNYKITQNLYHFKMTKKIEKVK